MSLHLGSTLKGEWKIKLLNVSNDVNAKIFCIEVLHSQIFFTAKQKLMKLQWKWVAASQLIDQVVRLGFNITASEIIIESNSIFTIIAIFNLKLSITLTIQSHFHFYPKVKKSPLSVDHWLEVWINNSLVKLV